MTEAEVEVLNERLTGPPEVHPTAIVEPQVELADGVRVGPYAVIEGDVRIGAGTQVDSHVRIYAGTRIGRDNADLIVVGRSLIPEPTADTKNNTAERPIIFFRPKASAGLPTNRAPTIQPTMQLLTPQPFTTGSLSP